MCFLHTSDNCGETRLGKGKRLLKTVHYVRWRLLVFVRMVVLTMQTGVVSGKVAA